MGFRISAIGLATLALTACDIGQGVKTLGKTVVGGTGTGATDSDSFAVTLAYRNPTDTTATGRRTVSIQGIRAIPSANLVNECGATGSTCVCEFFRQDTANSTPTSLGTSISVGISSQNNSFSCVIPASVADESVVKYVELKRVDDVNKNTGLLTVKTTLTIDDILGSSLVKTKVRGIFRYQCNRTFFEGEGVTAGNITCVAGQHLGVIGAAYNFYTYKSGEDSNLPGGDSAFPADICKRNSFLKIQCTGNTPDLRYGFYKDSADPFVVGIQMTRAPEAAQGDTSPLTSNYGFAALPDSAGNCPTGLIKVRPWVAQPASIIQGSLDGTNPSSSFINSNNSLNNTVVEQSAPAAFIVTRQPNIVPCDGITGDCTNAVFGGQVQAQSVAYTPLTPVVCAIPPNLLIGLF
jgi:hypothetical protein